ncbi:GHKL domain-containing protein [Amycolatopsis sp. NPDC005961]|uniref:sensor histidine kinase n=1 Tax=Amycolatopsis sp. NPDC005961 TaxID=3156720 RepID=UPI0033EF802D
MLNLTAWLPLLGGLFIAVAVSWSVYQHRYTRKELARLRQTEKLIVRYADFLNVIDGTAKEVSDSAAIASDAIREVAHALNTPLSQIELSLASAIAQQFEGGDELTQRLRKAIRAIDTCRATITSFEHLSTMAKSAAGWDVDDLEIALIAALEMYVEGSENSISTEVVAPRSVRGHANHFLIAATLPLLQNAVECASSGTLVKCTVSSDGNQHNIEVTNACPTKPDLRSMQRDGFTNKGAGHSGMGLKTARTLVHHLGGSLRFTYRDKTVLAQIILGG